MATATDVDQLAEAVKAHSQQLDSLLSTACGEGACKMTLGTDLIYYRGGQITLKRDGLVVPAADEILCLIGTVPLKPGDDPVAAAISAVIRTMKP